MEYIIFIILYVFCSFFLVHRAKAQQANSLQDKSDPCETSAKAEQDMQTFNNCVQAIESASGFLGKAVAFQSAVR